VNLRRFRSIGRYARCLARRHWFALRLIVCFAAMTTATLFVGLEDSGGLIWVANGLLLSYLLIAPRWRWAHYFAVGFAGELAGGLVLNPERWASYIMLTCLNVAEVAIGAFLLRKRSLQLPRFTDRRYLFQFIGYAVVVAPVTAGLMFALAYAIWTKSAPWQAMTGWITTDALGTAIVTPACVALFRSHLRGTGKWNSDWPFPLVLVGVTVAAFAQTRVPIIFLIYPIVALILFRFGLGWASMSALFVAAIGSWYTVHGAGPFSQIEPGSPMGAAVVLQLYVASGMFMIFAASSVMDTLRTTENCLRKIVSLHQLVTENSRDAILIVDFEGNPAFISPALERITGWKPEEMKSMGFAQMVHPEDSPRVAEAVSGLRPSGEGVIVEHRIRKRNGAYVWVEGNVRAIADPATGITSGLLAILRDISLRKQAEKKLREAHGALEALAITDPLTQLANRRRFDQYLSTEWRRAMRDHNPFSLLFLDADWFKSYNDTYGHLRGDGCLKQIAESALDVITRSTDLVARIGGEEFAVILPNTSNAGALELADKICEALRCRRLPHSSNPLGDVTISAGCATIAPALGQHSAVLIQKADEAMYAAKRQGRNRVCNASAESADCLALPAGVSGSCTFNAEDS
jgi:diguanylate cyclase (GGDEF)-like protein/PAS domain S-box-containing protein